MHSGVSKTYTAAQITAFGNCLRGPKRTQGKRI